MTTQDILLLSFVISKEAAFCRGESNWWPPRDDEIRLVKTLLDEGNFIDYLLQGEKVRPVVMKLRKSLREFLECAADELIDGNPKAMTVKMTVPFCETWISWIDTYFPPVEAQAAARRETPAAKMLASQELQVVKQKLVDTGLIKDGEWMGSPAQFKELVYSLHAQWDVENRGGYAWIDCARWAGYPTDKNSIKSAQNAGKVNPGEALGDIADTIREICLKPTK